MNFANPLQLIISFGALVIAITVHEFAHAWVADHLGDPTPRLQGRLTLNPLAHLDPLGTILILVVGFGWGRPVEFDPFNLRSPRKDAALISLAGPASNILLAVVASLLLRILVVAGYGLVAMPILGTIITLNLVLAVFNLIPVGPLDGFKIVAGFLSAKQAKEWNQLERYGMFFLVLLLLPLFSGASLVSRVLYPILNILIPLFIPGLPVV